MRMLCIALFVSALLPAQAAQSEAGRGYGPHSGPMSQIGLTKEQHAQIKAIRQREGKPQTQEARKALREDVMAVLTPEQRDKLKALREARHTAKRTR